MPVTPAIITTTRRTRWAALVTANHPWMTSLLAKAAATNTYPDFGNWAGIAYQITGTSSYATKAWAKLRPIIIKDPSSTNEVRENATEYAILYTWIYDALSSDARTEFANGLNRWGEWCNGVNTAKYVGGWLYSDSDQCTGQYLFCRLIDLILGTSWSDTPGARLAKDAIVGVTKTLANGNSIFVPGYVQGASGGEWIESSDYNAGTVKLLLLGYAAVNSLAGSDQFPTITALIDELADFATWDLVPGLQQSIQWGDDENPRNPHYFARLACLSMLAGLSGDASCAKLVAAAATSLASFGSGPPAGVGLWRAMYLPEGIPNVGATSSPLSTGSRFADGMGMLRWRDATTLFHTQSQPYHGVHHEMRVSGDFQLWKSEEFAITHPIGYGGACLLPQAHNTLTLAGLLIPEKGTRTQVDSSGDDWCAMTGFVSGPYYLDGYYNPPPEFLHSWARTVYYGNGIMVIRDKVRVDDPRLLPNFPRYRTSDKAAINAMAGLIQWTIHSPVEPTLNQSTYQISWTTPKGQDVLVRFLETPAVKALETVNELVLWGQGNANYMQLTEKKWHARLVSDATEATITAVITIDATPDIKVLEDGSIRVDDRIITIDDEGAVTIDDTEDPFPDPDDPPDVEDEESMDLTAFEAEYTFENGGDIDTVFGVNFPAADSLSHAPKVWGNFHLTDAISNAIEEDVVDWPRGTGGRGLEAAAHNSIIFSGLPFVMAEGTRNVTAGSGTTGNGYEFRWVVGTIGGPYYPAAYSNPPPEFLHEWTRTIIYVHPGMIRIRDHVVMDDPKALANYTRYKAADRTLIEARPALLEWVFHTPLQSDGYPNDMHGSLVFHLPTSNTHARLDFLEHPPWTGRGQAQQYDETAFWGTGQGIAAPELKWHRRWRVNPPAGSTSLDCIIEAQIASRQVGGPYWDVPFVTISYDADGIPTIEQGD